MTKLRWLDHPDILKRLKTLADAGHTASAIAAMFGVTRNMIAGKCHRLGIKLKGRKICGDHKPVARATRQRTRQRIRPPCPVQQQYRKPPDARAPEPVLLNGQRLTLLTIGRNQCHWPHGVPDTDDFHLCGHDRAENGPYCPYHHARAHVNRALAEQAAE